MTDKTPTVAEIVHWIDARKALLVAREQYMHMSDARWMDQREIKRLTHLRDTLSDDPSAFERAVTGYVAGHLTHSVEFYAYEHSEEDRGMYEDQLMENLERARLAMHCE